MARGYRPARLLGRCYVRGLVLEGRYESRPSARNLQ